jgi:hypothetical protein
MQKDDRDFCLSKVGFTCNFVVYFFLSSRSFALLITTYHYRIKDSGKANRVLSKMSRSVNMVWNFCKQTQQEALKNKSVKLIDDKKSGEKASIPYFLTKFEMNNLVSGSSKELELHSQTVQFVSEEYITRRKQFKTLLRWRGKKSLGMDTV